MQLYSADSARATGTTPFLVWGSSSTESHRCDTSLIVPNYFKGSIRNSEFVAVAGLSSSPADVSSCLTTETVTSVAIQVLRSAIHAFGREFRLREPLRIHAFPWEAGWCFESKILGISAFGRSEVEALESFSEDFSVLWDSVAQAKDDLLTGDAIALKHAFQRIVAAVEAE